MYSLITLLIVCAWNVVHLFLLCHSALSWYYAACKIILRYCFLSQFVLVRLGERKVHLTSVKVGRTPGVIVKIDEQLLPTLT